MYHKKTPVVLEKSYFLGASQQEIGGLFANYRALIPIVIFEELMTTEYNRERARCFRKMPPIENSVNLIPNVEH